MGLKINSLQWFTTVALLFITLTISSGYAIICWDCNSQYHPGCGDPFDQFSLGSVNCSQRGSKVAHLTDDKGQPLEANFCRKTYQTVNGETRIIRGCGWVPNPKHLKDRNCFNRAGTSGVQLLHCVCKEDNCNGSTSLTAPLFSVFFALIVGIKNHFRQ